MRFDAVDSGPVFAAGYSASGRMLAKGHVVGYVAEPVRDFIVEPKRPEHFSPDADAWGDEPDEPSEFEIEVENAMEAAGVTQRDMFDCVPRLYDTINTARLGMQNVRLHRTISPRGAGWNPKEIPLSQLPNVLHSAVMNYLYGVHGNEDPLHGGYHFFQHDREG